MNPEFENTRDPSKELLKEEVPENEGHLDPHFPEEEMASKEDSLKDAPIDTIFDEAENLPQDVLASIDFDLSEAGRWLLKVVSGPNNGAEFALQPASTYLLGTDPNTCDIVFHDTSISRQHARLSVGTDEVLTLEDLNSRNGTLLDGDVLQGKQVLEANTLVSMGTTSFVIFDREGQMQTVISPFLPSIVKALKQKEEPLSTITPSEMPIPETSSTLAEPPLSGLPQQAPPPSSPPRQLPTGALILAGILSGVVIVTGIAITSLFRENPAPVESKQDPTKVLEDIFVQFPVVKYSFNKASGKLLIVGHVLTGMERNQLIYDLQGIKAVRSIDESGLIIDEYVWQEANQILSKTPNWRGVTIHSPKAGSFVLSGYLQSREQAERLYDYVSANFPYLDLLEKRVIVEEEVISTVGNALRNSGFRDIQVRMRDGELTLSGGVPLVKKNDFEGLVKEFEEIPGIRSVKNLVVNLAPEQSIKNITSNYSVSGSSTQDGGVVSVVINGRILTTGDILDGMKIEKITPRFLLLEKDGVKYRIDYR